MVKRKLSRNTDDDLDGERYDPAAPRRSSCLATNTVSIDDDSHGRSNSGSNSSSGKKSLSSAALVQKVLKMVEDENQAELMVLKLMREYSFSFPRLKELLRRKVNQPHLFNLYPTNYCYRK